ncbi:hypothetical protein I4U23_015016 [Adineta vaga]|nr:hypothetical protein I4U23_015016 [Adineta vaga]
MTNIITTREDEYAYVQYKLPDEELFIVGYTPMINSSVAHHMLTYACLRPGSDKPFWIQGGSCQGEQMIIHGWGLNAPPLKLPEDVGFPVGKNTPYKYIVANIHYLTKTTGDSSGNQIILSRKPRKYHAGIMLSGTSGIHLSPKTQNIRTPFSCHYNGPPISIFAIRVHAHKWARVNSLYRVRDGKVSEVAKGNPQWPQAFYPLPSPVQIEKGDVFIGQCVYDNNDSRDIYAGSTHNDEMCNVYAMYWYEPALSDGGKPPVQNCWDDALKEMSSLLPPDSLIPPPNPAGMTDMDHSAHNHGHETTENTNQYVNIETWPDQKVTINQLGHIGGIALNNANNELVVFHRASRKWEFQYFDGVRFRHETYGPIKEEVLTHIDTQTGQIKARWGANMFYMPHGVTIDHRGNIWLTDIAIIKYLSLIVGEKFQSGSGQNQFCRPADVVVMKNGDFFVADGYCNNRIIKFNQQGQFIKEWGTSMSGKKDGDGYPLPNEWNIVHSIALNEDAQLICAADRENFRIQCFHPDTGNFLRQIHVEPRGTMGAIYAIEFASTTNGAILFAVTGGPQTANEKIYMINAQNGEIMKSFGVDSHLTAAHDITVSREAQEIYVGELVSPPGNALHKLVLSKNKIPSPSSKPTSWINYRQQGFDRLEQNSEGEEENQLLYSDEDDQITTSNENDGTVKIKVKQNNNKFNNKTNAAALKLGDIIQLIDSSRCLKKCTFEGVPLNSSFPIDICPSTQINDDINQQCMVQLTIDFSTGLINGSFDAEPRAIMTENRLVIDTKFLLNEISVKLDVNYNCSVSDFCDLEFVRETLSPSLAMLDVESFRQTLATNLYHPNNTGPIQCQNDDICPQNTSLCFISYIHWSRSGNIHVNGGCQKLDSDDFPHVHWIQLYEPDGVKYGLTQFGIYYCNTENCGKNITALNTFQMLERDYIIPINTSVINATTPPWPTETTTLKPTTISTTDVTTTTTTTNHASSLLEHFSSIILLSFSILHIIYN